jgi:hypothetical protein
MTTFYVPGQTQLRGRMSWKFRRARVMVSHGPTTLSKLPIVFGNAIPKSGSKLLFNILRSLELIGPFVDTRLNEIKPFFNGAPTPKWWVLKQLDALRPGDIRFGYLYSSHDYVERLASNTWATFLIIRDPRDQIISEVYYALQIHLGHALHDYLKQLPDMQACINVLITGIEEGPLKRVGVEGHYGRFQNWLEQPAICTIRYEDLIKDRNGEVNRILTHIRTKGFEPQIPHEEAVQTLIAAMEPARSETYRKGRAGAWREHFSERNIELFKAHAGKLLIDLGYENDLDW